ncbi:hypothetical protein RBB50_006641 [Rhinocladiella similis]|jgi:acetyl esterase/lipase
MTDRQDPEEKAHEELSQHNHSQSRSASIQITRRTDLSTLYKIVRTLIRPLRPRLVKLGKDIPAGSQRLSAPKRRGCEVIENQREGVWEYTFRHVEASQIQSQTRSRSQSQFDNDKPIRMSNAAKTSSPTSTSPSSKKQKHRIYYFSGGGFQSPPSSGHWLLLAKLAKDLQLSSSETESTEFEVTMVSPPLAPASPAPDALPVLRRWVTSVLDDAVQRSDSTESTETVTVTLAGDSSGANVALSLGMWAVQELPEQASRALSSIFAISPPVDLRNVNEEIKVADRYDPILTIGLTGDVACAWVGGVESNKRPGNTTTTTATSTLGEKMSTSDPSVSPLLHSDKVFENLRNCNVCVHGVVGTHDVLAPDALEMMRKCDRFGVLGEWLVWEGQMHCFPLAGVGDILGLREGKEGRMWIEDVLKRNVARSRSQETVSV